MSAGAAARRATRRPPLLGHQPFEATNQLADFWTSPTPASSKMRDLAGAPDPWRVAHAAKLVLDELFPDEYV